MILFFSLFIPLKAYRLLNVPTDLTFRNSAFFPQVLYLCFACVLEQTENYALCDIQ